MSEVRRQLRYQHFDAMLGLFAPGRVVDLGAGHGEFAKRAAAAGWDTTAVDARTERFDTDHDSVTWVQQDVREFDVSGFDLVLCLGLFYHLTVEDQVALLDRISVPLILDTHVATPDPTHPLSPPTEAGGYQGRYYDEGNWARRPTASWNNAQSFWPRRGELYRMLREHGFPTVLAAQPWVTRDRTFFLCLPGRD